MRIGKGGGYQNKKPSITERLFVPRTGFEPVIPP